MIQAAEVYNGDEYRELAKHCGSGFGGR